MIRDLIRELWPWREQRSNAVPAEERESRRTNESEEQRLRRVARSGR